METANILCEKTKHIVLNDLLENFRTLLQDSHAEKELIKNSLRKMTDNTTYFAEYRRELYSYDEPYEKHVSEY